MSLKLESPLLRCYWVSWKRRSQREPQGIYIGQPQGRGFGITAFSQEDAIKLLEEKGYASELKRADEMIWTEVEDMGQLDQNHILPNAGPTYFRGIWYPRHNIS
jgi:hypothetical protein